MDINNPAIEGAAFIVTVATLLAVGVYELWRWLRPKDTLPDPDRSALRRNTMERFEKQLHLRHERRIGERRGR